MVTIVNSFLLFLYCSVIIIWILGYIGLINIKVLLLVLYRDRFSKYVGNICFIALMICFLIIIVINISQIITNYSEYNQSSKIIFQPILFAVFFSVIGFEGIQKNGIKLRNNKSNWIFVNEYKSIIDKDSVIFNINNEQYKRYFINTKRNRKIITK